MASGHVNRIKRPDTWLHRPMLQNVKKVLANPEPSTHDPTETSARISGSNSEARFRPYESARLRRTLLPVERGANMRRREFLGILGSSVAAWPLRWMPWFSSFY